MSPGVQVAEVVGDLLDVVRRQVVVVVQDLILCGPTGALGTFQEQFTSSFKSNHGFT